MSHLVKIEDSSKKTHFINLNHVISITSSDFKDNIWKISLTNGIYITVESKNLPPSLKQLL